MLAVVLVAVGLLLFVIERTAGPVVVRQVPPDAEFLIAAGDSTYWVRSTKDGIRVRSAPILLTEADGRIHELFITDETHDYAQATFSAGRIWARDLLREDSLLLFDDGAVGRELEAWRRRHPGAAPVDPEVDDVPDEPPTSAIEELTIVEVHGAWVSFGQSLDIDVEGRTDHVHRVRRGVLDLQSGRQAALTDLFGAAEADRLEAAGRAALAAVRDSIAAATDDRAEQARSVLGSFVFDPLGFSLTDVAREPAVAFLVPGTAADGTALSLHLRAIPAATPGWWPPVQATLPVWSADSSMLAWDRGAYRIVARPLEGGERLALVIVAADSTSTARREWPIATVGTPAYQLVALDAAPLTDALRRALSRAFDRSSAVDGTVQRASLDRSGGSATWSPRYIVRLVRLSEAARSMRRSRARPSS
jgi:hypothetical protein